MAWLYLILAGLFEMGWPLGFKLANLCPRYHFLFLALSVVSMGVSGWLLYVAQRTIPMGTAYMIWTTIFRPTMPTKTSDRKNIRQKVTASWKKTMPRTTVPTPPMVH